jgi:hypothetical protein
VGPSALGSRGRAHQSAGVSFCEKGRSASADSTRTAAHATLKALCTCGTASPAWRCATIPTGGAATERENKPTTVAQTKRPRFARSPFPASSWNLRCLRVTSRGTLKVRLSLSRVLYATTRGGLPNGRSFSPVPKIGSCIVPAPGANELVGSPLEVVDAVP